MSEISASFARRLSIWSYQDSSYSQRIDSIRITRPAIVFASAGVIVICVRVIDKTQVFYLILIVCQKENYKLSIFSSSLMDFAIIMLFS
jgi:hypothetical protein